MKKYRKPKLVELEPSPPRILEYINTIEIKTLINLLQTKSLQLPMFQDICSRDRINTFPQERCTTGKMAAVVVGIFEFAAVRQTKSLLQLSRKSTGLPTLLHPVRAFSLQSPPTLRMAGGVQRGPPVASALHSFGEAAPGALCPVLQSWHLSSYAAKGNYRL